MAIRCVWSPRVFADSYGSSGSKRSWRPDNALVRRAFPAAVAIAAVLAALVIVANTALTGIQLGELKLGPVLGPAADPNFVPGGAPLGQIGSDPDDPSDPWSAAAPPGGVIVQTPGPTAGPNATGSMRMPTPKTVPIGPRPVASAAGHWKRDEAPGVA